MCVLEHWSKNTLDDKKLIYHYETVKTVLFQTDFFLPIILLILIIFLFY